MVRAARRVAGRLWSRMAPIVARLRPDLWTQRQWIGRSREYWTRGWRDDPRGMVNSPATYWADGNEDESYTPDLIRFLKNLKRPLDSFLEIGCNAGRNLFHVGRLFPNAKLSGIEINREAIEFARAHVPGARQWDLRCGDLANPAVLEDFPDHSVDIVFSMAVLVHLPPGDEKRRIINECLRIARIGLLLIEPHRAGHPVWNTVADKRISPFSIDDHRRYLPTLDHLELTHRGPDDPYRVLFFPAPARPAELHPLVR